MIGVFLDTETNGLNPKIHAILEIAYQIVDLSTGEVKEKYQAVVAQPLEVWQKSDPGSLKVNGFTWEEVSLGNPLFRVKEEVIASLARWKVQRKEALFICQNPSFDRIFFSQLIDPDIQEALHWPYHWLDLASMHWALSMKQSMRHQGPFPWDIGCSKDQIAAYYQLPPEEKPHRAMNGVQHLLLCYTAVVGFPLQGISN